GGGGDQGAFGRVGEAADAQQGGRRRAEDRGRLRRRRPQEGGGRQRLDVVARGCGRGRGARARGGRGARVTTFAIISDLHANLEAVEAVLQRIDQLGVRQTVCLGDVVDYGADPGPTPRLVVDRCTWTIPRNHH